MLDEKTKKQHKRKWNDKYDNKSYHRLTIKLRIEDDADIIASYEDAQKQGEKGREWLRELFYNKK